MRYCRTIWVNRGLPSPLKKLKQKAGDCLFRWYSYSGLATYNKYMKSVDWADQYHITPWWLSYYSFLRKCKKMINKVSNGPVNCVLFNASCVYKKSPSETLRL